MSSNFGIPSFAFSTSIFFIWLIRNECNEIYIRKWEKCQKQYINNFWLRTHLAMEFAKDCHKHCLQLKLSICRSNVMAYSIHDTTHSPFRCFDWWYREWLLFIHSRKSAPTNAVARHKNINLTFRIMTQKHYNGLWNQNAILFVFGSHYVAAATCPDAFGPFSI